MATGDQGRVVPNAPRSGWSVLSQQEVMDLDAAGRPVSGMRIEFRSGKGVQASIFVPKSEYTPDNVRARLAAAAYTVDQVHGLQG